MNYNELKKDMFIAWNADRVFSEWNTYGIVIKVNKKTVTIKTFDDMKETTLDLQGDAVKSEISAVTVERIEEYLSKKETDLQIKIIETESKFKNDMRYLNKQVKTLRELTKTISV